MSATDAVDGAHS